MIASIPLSQFLVIDIETVSCKPRFDALDEEWQALWAAKAGKNLPADTTLADFYRQRAGVMAEFSRIICICIGYYRKEGDQLQFRVKSLTAADEKELLQELITTLQQLEDLQPRWQFAGHNIREFDIPFICRRMLINGMAIPACLDFQHMKPWETNIVDTFQYWRFGDYKQYTSLALLAAALGIPSPKDDIDGSQVGSVYWEQQDLPRIARYCRKDVVTVANILLRFRNQPLLTEDAVVFVN